MKRTKRWNNRKKRRELERETPAGGGGLARSSSAPAGDRGDKTGVQRTKWQETTERWKMLQVMESERQRACIARVNARGGMHTRIGAASTGGVRTWACVDCVSPHAHACL